MNAKTLLIAISIFILGQATLVAQKNTDNNEIKEKVARVVEQLDVAFKMGKDKRSAIEAIFTDFYTDQQKLKNNIQRPNSGLTQGLASQDFQSVRKKNENLITERDNLLKKELSEDEYKKWKGEIEPSLFSNRKNK